MVAHVTQGSRDQKQRAKCCGKCGAVKQNEQLPAFRQIATDSHIYIPFNERPRMRFFIYSPVEMSEHDAFALIKEHLQDDMVIQVRRNKDPRVVFLTPGQRPRAFPNTFLVRVEPDDSLRIIEQRLD